MSGKEVCEGFDDIFMQLPEKRDGLRCTIAGADSSEKLCRLLDHPKIVESASSLLGCDFNYRVGDANYCVGGTGCLRVIPGSQCNRLPQSECAL